MRRIDEFQLQPDVTKMMANKQRVTKKNSFASASFSVEPLQITSLHARRLPRRADRPFSSYLINLEPQTQPFNNKKESNDSMNNLRPTLSPFTQEDACLVAAPTQEDLNIESDSGVITSNPRHLWPSMTPPEWLGLGRRPLCSPLPPSHETSNTKQEIDTNTNDLEPAPRQITQAPSNRRSSVHRPALPFPRHKESRRHETTRFAKCAALKAKQAQLESHLRAQELALRAQNTDFYESQVKAQQEIMELKHALKRLTSRTINFVLAGEKALGPESALDDQRIAGRGGNSYRSGWLSCILLDGVKN